MLGRYTRLISLSVLSLMNGCLVDPSTIATDAQIAEARQQANKEKEVYHQDLAKLEGEIEQQRRVQEGSKEEHDKRARIIAENRRAEQQKIKDLEKELNQNKAVSTSQVPTPTGTFNNSSSTADSGSPQASALGQDKWKAVSTSMETTKSRSGEVATTSSSHSANQLPAQKYVTVDRSSPPKPTVLDCSETSLTAQIEDPNFRSQPGITRVSHLKGLVKQCSDSVALGLGLAQTFIDIKQPEDAEETLTKIPNWRAIPKASDLMKAIQAMKKK